MLRVRHAFASGKADGPDATKVQASNWNADLIATMATARFLGRTTAGEGEVEELTAAQMLAAIGAEAAGTAAAAVAAHEAAGDPHAQYLTQAEGDGLYAALANAYSDEKVDDRVAALLQNGGGLTWSYNDGLGQLSATVSITSGSVSDFTEAVQDVMGAILADTATIDWTYTDAANTLVADLKDNSVTFAKMQDIATDRLLGRDTAATGDPEEIALGYGLAFTGGPGIAAALSQSSAYATAQTTISAATYADITGASLSLAAGTWLVIGTIVHGAVNAIYQGFFAITDGANAVVSEVAQSRPASGTASLQSPMSAVVVAIVSPGSTTTYKLRAARGLTTHTASFTVMDGNGVNTTNHLTNNTDKGTGIFAVRIA